MSDILSHVVNELVGAKGRVVEEASPEHERSGHG